MQLEIGKIYKFKDNHYSLKGCLIGKRFKFITEDKIEVYNDEGRIIYNLGTGNPFFMVFDFYGVSPHVDSSYCEIKPHKILPRLLSF